MGLKGKFLRSSYGKMFWSTLFIFSLKSLDWSLPNLPLNPNLCQNVMFFHENIDHNWPSIWSKKHQILNKNSAPPLKFKVGLSKLCSKLSVTQFIKITKQIKPKIIYYSWAMYFSHWLSYQPFNMPVIKNRFLIV